VKGAKLAHRKIREASRRSRLELEVTIAAQALIAEGVPVRRRSLDAQLRRQRVWFRNPEKAGWLAFAKRMEADNSP
jgi:hypothetical protein